MRDVGTNTSIPTVDETEYWEASTLAIMPSHPYLECLNTVFDKFVNALGACGTATPEAPIDYVKHTANVLRNSSTMTKMDSQTILKSTDI